MPVTLKLQKAKGDALMTTIKDILEFFEEFASVDTAMDFDNCGLLIGSKTNL